MGIQESELGTESERPAANNSERDHVGFDQGQGSLEESLSDKRSC